MSPILVVAIKAVIAGTAVVAFAAVGEFLEQFGVVSAQVAKEMGLTLIGLVAGLSTYP